MVLRHLHESTPEQHGQPAQPRPVSDAFLESQQNVPAPFGIVLQIAHSELTGHLARKLLPEAFGELPPEAVEAAWKHDLGWAESDARQTGQMPDVTPKPFPAVPEEELPSWQRGLALSAQYPPLTRVLIGRHFAALANKPSPQHESFLNNDMVLIRALEESLGHSEEDLKRWTAAVGFCDLLSLVLCVGIEGPIVFPLAHPAASDADQAHKVTFTITDGQVTSSEPIFQPDTHLSVGAQRFDPQTGELHPLALRWSFQ